MAKKVAEKTPIQKAAEKARDAYRKAKDAAEKTDNDVTRKALEHAKIERDKAVVAENRERFLRVGGGRVTKAITAIEQVGKLNQPNSYEFSENDVTKIREALSNSLTGALSALEAAKKGNTKKDSVTFSFE